MVNSVLRMPGLVGQHSQKVQRLGMAGRNLQEAAIQNLRLLPAPGTVMAARRGEVFG
jgi:hypothetical protein